MSVVELLGHSRDFWSGIILPILVLNSLKSPCYSVFGQIKLSSSQGQVETVILGQVPMKVLRPPDALCKLANDGEISLMQKKLVFIM